MGVAWGLAGERLPQEVHEKVFEWVLKIAVEKKLLKGNETES